MMTVKRINTQELYPILQSWWDGHNFPHVSPSILPEYNFVCYNEDKPVYSISFYNTDSNLVWLGFPVSNPYVENTDRRGCFKHLIEGVEEYAKELNYQVLFTTSDHPYMDRILKDNKFNLSDNRVNHYMKII